MVTRSRVSAAIRRQEPAHVGGGRGVELKATSAGGGPGGAGARAAAGRTAT
jgi:hypothetical protein